MSARRWGFTKILIYITAIDFLGAALITLSRGALSMQYAVYMAIVWAATMLTYLLIRTLDMGEGYLFFAGSFLGSVGIVMLLRLSDENTDRVRWFILGVACYFFAAQIYRSFEFWHRLTWVYVALGAVLFILTLAFGVVRGGAKNWIILFGYSVQPAEITKILLVFALSAIFTSPTAGGKNKLSEFYNTSRGRVAAAHFVTYLFMGFLLLQREWGLALLFFAVFLVYLGVYADKKYYLALNLALMAVMCILAYHIMPHIRTRVVMWQNPYSDPSGGGYQILQSLFAIASGGFLGRGIGAGSPYYIPDVQTDFIFSAVCEEMGILGGVGIILIFFVLVYRGIKISLRTTNEFNKAVALGLSALLAVQTFIIIGGVTKMIPMTGITLPFMSRGGSSLITAFTELGILQGISARKGDISDDLQ